MLKLITLAWLKAGLKYEHINREPPSSGVLSVYRESLLDLLNKHGISVEAFTKELSQYFLQITNTTELMYALPEQIQHSEDITHEEL